MKRDNPRLKNPWTESHVPFKIAENVYFVGTTWVSAFLLDTSEGLVLIDCAMQETFYLIVDSIHRLGFDPRKIKKLFLTHGHYDHCGAARAVYEMSGCEIWLGKEDEYFFTQRRDLIFMEDHVPEFPIHHFYEYDEPIDLGNFQITPVHCPGHTPGTTSFFFEVPTPVQMQVTQKRLLCGLHGGLGEITLTDESLRKKNWPSDMRRIYCESVDRVIDLPVDIVLPSHAEHGVDYDFYKIAEQDDGSGAGFVDRGAWKRMLSARKEAVLALDKQSNSHHSN